MDLLKYLTALPNGDQVCIIQSASEMPDTYTVEEKLSAGVEEITGRVIA